MKIYIRKIFEHDIKKQISITKSIVSHFFENKDQFDIKGKTKGEIGVATILLSTDPRLGGDIKKIIKSEIEPNDLEIDDLLLISEKKDFFEIEVIRKNNVKYSTLIDLFNDDERHIFTYKDELEEITINKTRDTDSKNIIYYGVPGVGKSYTINRDFNLDDQNSHRVVFHPDYTYGDFVGQILPQNVDDGKGEEKLKYEFVPGPFTNALKQAKENPSKDIYLIIEEINRGNAPAIFGDLFQLLDRDDSGKSQYEITNFDIANKVHGNKKAKVYLPSNLYIIATMNTADQNVFTLDTAFQRRWEMRHIPNKINEAKHSNEQIANSGVSWGAFATVINELITNNNDGFGDLGDKRLGAYFVKNELKDKEKFAGKVLKYLWDDAFKMDREKLFKPEIKMLDEMLEKFGNSGNFDDIFIAEVCKNLKDKNLNFEEKNEPQNSANDGVIDNSTIDDGGADESSNEN
ncbi:AAA family ATPase [Campylobacter sp. 46490-21]|uniref:McrB family protein n=1 Tax=Campylobacter magnus TaxID=3026462 RepID=UPI002361F55B|nr:AAA family ATPase [Campylobacter magnus]MDD0848722.1 AAA family ATPase [Campylobacter magnus]